jgi:hypothetical protein
MRPEFSRKLVEKYIKLNEIQSNWRGRTEEQTDRHDESNSRFSLSCESA